MRRVCPRTFECIGKTAGFAKLAQGDGLNSPTVLLAMNAVMLPRAVPLSFSTPAIVAMPGLDTLIM